MRAPVLVFRLHIPRRAPRIDAFTLPRSPRSPALEPGGPPVSASVHGEWIRAAFSEFLAVAVPKATRLHGSDGRGSEWSGNRSCVVLLRKLRSEYAMGRA